MLIGVVWVSCKSGVIHHQLSEEDRSDERYERRRPGFRTRKLNQFAWPRGYEVDTEIRRVMPGRLHI
jgi:hypothetical protein